MLTVPRFGDVIKVKILFRKRDSAMVEFRNAEQVTRLPRIPVQYCPFPYPRLSPT